MIARHIVGAAGHRHHVGLGRRQRDARRNGDERHRHGEDAKGHKAAMQGAFHGTKSATAVGSRQEVTFVFAYHLATQRRDRVHICPT
jgi:hypothetical protein